MGTLTPRKGYRVLIDALAQLSELPWRLRIVGDTDRSVAEFDALTAAVARAGLADRIKFAGLLEPAALEAAFQASDLFVMPSLYEGFGMALTEAMARGLPIVSTTGVRLAIRSRTAQALRYPRPTSARWRLRCGPC
ncbi:glycosyltransferase [Arthrobacter ulcerisalmonis]|uniref:glycosyltransferase n=1 Tax=Arthrobacter ulcerisalmonis TaxID=2483813 RepID=UPI00363726B4